MPGPVFRRGERIELRTIEPEDAEFLQRLVNDPRVRSGIAAVDPVTGPQEREWVESIGEDDATKLLVCRDGEPVGTISLEPVNEVWGVGELGYMIAPSEWNNGYATDAVRTMCGYAFEERRVAKVAASVYESNPASARALEKVGFTEEARLRAEAFVAGERVDLLRYGLLATEWGERSE